MPVAVVAVGEEGKGGSHERADDVDRTYSTPSDCPAPPIQNHCTAGRGRAMQRIQSVSASMPVARCHLSNCFVCATNTLTAPQAILRGQDVGDAWLCEVQSGLSQDTA